MTITVLATVVAVPGKHQLALVELAEYAAYTQSEPGTLVFQVFTDPARLDAITVLEVYADAAALEAHAETPERANLGRRLEELAESLEVQWLDSFAGHGLPQP
jgi:quinol monooxygenase YgiN